MKKGTIISLGLVGLGLALSSSKKSSSISKETFETGTTDILNAIDQKVLFSQRQISIVANDLIIEGKDPIKVSIIRTWRGLIQIEIEGQLTDLGKLTYPKILAIDKDLTAIIRKIMVQPKALISEYFNANSYLITDSIFTIEKNLINISKTL